MKKIIGIIMIAICFVLAGTIFLLRCLVEILWFGRKPNIKNMDFTKIPLLDMIVDAADYSLTLIYNDYKK